MQSPHSFSLLPFPLFSLPTFSLSLSFSSPFSSPLFLTSLFFYSFFFFFFFFFYLLSYLSSYSLFFSISLLHRRSHRCLSTSSLASLLSLLLPTPPSSSPRLFPLSSCTNNSPHSRALSPPTSSFSDTLFSLFSSFLSSLISYIISFSYLSPSHTQSPIAPAAAIGPRCANCGAPAPDAYCPACGQSTRERLPTFSAVHARGDGPLRRLRRQVLEDARGAPVPAGIPHARISRRPPPALHRPGAALPRVEPRALRDRFASRRIRSTSAKPCSSIRDEAEPRTQDRVRRPRDARRRSQRQHERACRTSTGSCSKPIARFNAFRARKRWSRSSPGRCATARTRCSRCCPLSRSC